MNKTSFLCLVILLGSLSPVQAKGKCITTFIPTTTVKWRELSLQRNSSHSCTCKATFGCLSPSSSSVDLKIMLLIYSRSYRSSLASVFPISCSKLHHEQLSLWQRWIKCAVKSAFFSCNLDAGYDREHLRLTQKLDNINKRTRTSFRLVISKCKH